MARKNSADTLKGFDAPVESSDPAAEAIRVQVEGALASDGLGGGPTSPGLSGDVGAPGKKKRGRPRKIEIDEAESLTAEVGASIKALVAEDRAVLLARGIEGLFCMAGALSALPDMTLAHVEAAIPHARGAALAFGQLLILKHADNLKYLEEGGGVCAAVSFIGLHRARAVLMKKGYKNENVGAVDTGVSIRTPVVRENYGGSGCGESVGSGSVGDPTRAGSTTP